MLVDLFLKSERIRIAAGSAGLGAERVNRLEGVLRDVIFKGQTATTWWRSAAASAS